MFAMSPSRCSFCALTAIMVVAFLTAATEAQAKSPRALYKALLTSVIPRSQLSPVGFHSSTTKAFRIGTEQKRHHAIGEVSIDLDDGRNASIVYVVFPTRADAVGNLVDGLKLLKTQQGTTTAPAPNGIPTPAIVVRTSRQGLSITSITAVAGNVGINAISLRGLAETTRVAHLAVKHLNAVR